MGKVEFRRERNKIIFKKNVLGAWQNLEDTFFISLFLLFFNILLILSSFGFLKALTWPGLAFRAPGVLNVGVLFQWGGARVAASKALLAAPWCRGNCTLARGTGRD